MSDQDELRVNADFDRPVGLGVRQLPWLDSPQRGVQRRLLDRIGGEVARATSIVRYAPGSVFPRHGHALGEEFWVLDGIFQDESGDHPAGSYVRNPPGSAHAPRSSEGCTIFVKLRQMRPDQDAAVRIDARSWLTSPEPAPAFELYADDYETVWLQSLEPAQPWVIDTSPGIEMLLLVGRVRVGTFSHAAPAWFRIPEQQICEIVAETPARLWVKRAGFPATG